MKPEYTIHVGRYNVTSGYTPVDIGNGEQGIWAEELGRLELQAAVAVLTRVAPIEGDELKFSRKAMGLRQVDLAGLLDVTVETISRWETGAESIRRQTQLAVLQLLERTAKSGSPKLESLEAQNDASGVKIVAA